MILRQLISRRFVYQASVVALITVAFLTLTAFFGRHAYLELSTHFRLQYVLIASVCTGSLVGFKSWKLLPLAILCTLINLGYVLPFYFAPAPRPNYPSAIHLRLMQANVLNTNTNYAALIESVRDANPDVIVLAEVTEQWWAQVQVLNESYPYSKGVPKLGGSGIAIFSRYPLEEIEVLTFGASSHVALRARANVSGTRLTIFAFHPPSPGHWNQFLTRNEQFGRIGSLAQATSGTKILIGDFNTTMWSPYFSDLVRETGLRDARKGFGLAPTWRAELPAFLGIPIDHCLVSEDVIVEGLRTGRRTGSDHRPLIVDVQFKKVELAARQE